MKKLSVKDMAYCAIFTVLIIVGAYIKIPIPVVPFTLQFFFTTMAGIVLGRRLGSISVLAYMVLGLLGLPVFSSGGGIGYVMVPSFGYIIGFVCGTYVTGLIVEKSKRISVVRLMLASFAGLLVVYAIGMLYYYMICRFVLINPIGVWPLILYCFLLAVPGDIVLCVISGFVGKKVRRLV